MHYLRNFIIAGTLFSHALSAPCTCANGTHVQHDVAASVTATIEVPATQPVAFTHAAHKPTKGTKKSHSNLNTLIPSTHWDTDLGSYAHLEPNTSQTLFWGQHNDPSRPQQFALGQYELNLPAVVLEHSSYVKSVVCPSYETMIITINDKSAYEWMKPRWEPYRNETDDDMLLAGYFQGCSPSFEAGERSWSVVRDFRFSSQHGMNQIYCTIEHVGVQDVISEGRIELGFYAPHDSSKKGMSRRGKRGFFHDIFHKIKGEWNKLFGKHSKTFEKQFDVDVHTPSETTTIFGGRSGLTLLNTPEVSLYCLECGIKGQAITQGVIEWDIFGIKGGYLDFDGTLRTTIDLGLIMTKTYSLASWKYPVFNYGLLGWALPGILEVGPWLELDLTFDLDVQVVGELEFGMILDFPNPQFNLDFSDFSKSTASGWHGDVTPIIKTGIDFNANAKLAAPFGIYFGINILGGLFESSAYLKQTPWTNAYLKEHFEPDNFTIAAGWQIEGIDKPQSCPGLVAGIKAAYDIDAGFEAKAMGIKERSPLKGLKKKALPVLEARSLGFNYNRNLYHLDIFTWETCLFGDSDTTPTDSITAIPIISATSYYSSSSSIETNTYISSYNATQPLTYTYTSATISSSSSDTVTLTSTSIVTPAPPGNYSQISLPPITYTAPVTYSLSSTSVEPAMYQSSTSAEPTDYPSPSDDVPSYVAPSPYAVPTINTMMPYYGVSASTSSSSSLSITTTNMPIYPIASSYAYVNKTLPVTSAPVYLSTYLPKTSCTEEKGYVQATPMISPSPYN